MSVIEHGRVYPRVALGMDWERSRGHGPARPFVFLEMAINRALYPTTVPTLRPPVHLAAELSMQAAMRAIPEVAPRVVGAEQ